MEHIQRDEPPERGRRWEAARGREAEPPRRREPRVRRPPPKGVGMWVWLLAGGAVLALVGVAIGVLVVALGSTSDRISERNFRKLKVGMTQEEIVEILGEPDVMMPIIPEPKEPKPWAVPKGGPIQRTKRAEPKGQSLEWRTPNHLITVRMVAGKATVLTGMFEKGKPITIGAE
jgi:hypothetical protein